jgi:NACalpha-BTF3-like transcription factor
MHDFNCTNAADMNYNIMAERTRYLKENQEGVTEMCKAMEEMRNEAAREAAREADTKRVVNDITKIMKNLKVSLEDAMTALEIPIEERAFIKSLLSKTY